MISPSPGPSQVSLPSRSQLLVAYFVRTFSNLRYAWVATQVSHRGKYPIERLLALEEYTRRTSLTRAVLVCAGTPLPIIILVLSQEVLPLENPAAGWRVNWGFWIRVALLGGMTSLGIFSQLGNLIADVHLSSKQLIVQCIFMAVSYTVVSIVVAALWVFPVPFMVIAMSSPFLVLFVGSMRVTLGERYFRSLLENRYELQRFVNAVVVQVLMAVMYPAYQVLFNSVAGSHYELPVFLLLPVIKFVLKHLVAFSLRDLPELIPHNIIFTVHFFNALYLTTCMQSATSPFSVSVVMAIDFSETGLALLSIYRSTTRIMEQIRQTIGPTGAATTLLEAAFLLCQCHDKFTKEERDHIQVRSIRQHKLSASSRSIISQLDTSVLRPSFRRVSNTHSMPTMKAVVNFGTDSSRFRAMFSHQWGAKVKSVSPINAIHVKNLVHTEHVRDLQSVASVPAALHLATLRKALATLFTIECMVLSEYVEFIIPLLYGNYVRMMVRLSSAKYHMEMTGMTVENVESTMQTVFIYGMLELGSFILLVALMKRSCGTQALYQLAFVLESEALSIQSKMMGWMLMTLGFRIVHFGTSMRS